jgi:hypothetical protein
VATAGEAARRPASPSSCVARVARLPIIMGGVAITSSKKGNDGACKLKLDATALAFGTLANSFTAFKMGENGRLLADKGLAARHGTAAWEIR